jgi:N6-adenosine-specific RNA methylase IME4/ParB-like chromosome segregation protein Spo0J
VTRPAHPVADLFPLMSEAEVRDLADDIREHGLREPVWLHADGRIIDGRNRWRACELAGVEAVTRTYDGGDSGLVAFVVSLNLKRRHLNESQRARVGDRIALLQKGVRADTAIAVSAVTQEQAAELLSVSPDSIQRARVVREQGVPALGERVDAGHVAVSTAAVIAREPVEVQREVVQLDDREIVRRAKEIQARRREEQAAENARLAAETVRNIPTLDVTTGRFRCVVIDPPWPMEKIEREERPGQVAPLDYPTMPVFCTDHGDDCQTIECVVREQLQNAADGDGCHLYVWTTHRFLPDTLKLFERWGASYQCLMTWRKNVGITPFSWMYDTEHVVFGRLGSLKLKQLGLRLSFDAPVAGHSVKPDAFFDRVLAASPEPRLEMFARRKRDGFTVWGNEVPDGVL